MATKGYIRYRSAYKYQLASSYEINVPIWPRRDIVTDFIDLDTHGKLTVKKGYAWDGPSGPVKDTPRNMRGSLVHDALYQLMRCRELSARTHRRAEDEVFRTLCKEDGVSNLRASVYYKALRRFGRPAASPQNKKKIARAPKK